jgi:hypothetical protein
LLGKALNPLDRTPIFMTITFSEKPTMLKSLEADRKIKEVPALATFC